MRELFCVETCGSNLADRIAQPPCFVCPGPADEPTPPEPAVVPAAFSFSSGSSGGDIGFSKGVYGNVVNQPLADHELLEIARRSGQNFQVAFDGDCTDILDGYMPVIAGITFNETSPTWTFAAGTTTGNFTTSNSLASGTEYSVTWVKV